MATTFRDNPYMDISNKIAQCLNTWMATRTDLNTLEKVADRSRIGYSTVRRMRKGEDNNVTLASLIAVAKAFGEPLSALMGFGEPGVGEGKSEYANLHQIERDLVTWYRHTSPEARKMLQLIMQANPVPDPQAAPTAAQEGASQILDNHEKARKKLYRTAQALVKKTPTRKTQEKP